MCGAKQAGIEQFVIVVGYQGNQVRRWFAKSPLRRTSVIWVENPDFHKEQDAVDTGMFLCTPAVFDALEADRKLRAYDIQDAVWQDIDTPQMLDFTQVQMSPPPGLLQPQCELVSAASMPANNPASTVYCFRFGRNRKFGHSSD
jgi:NDP-sugar pyrophosphorylase family protein